MALVEVNASRFKVPYSWVNGTTYPNITYIDICRGAISVGASSPINLIAYGWRYLEGALFQGLSTGTLVTAVDGKLVTSSSLKNKVQTDKATATYWLSMALTKLVAERRLQIPWLCHVDRLIDQGVLHLLPGSKERGDLAGKDKHNLWHVIEVKGRSRNISSITIKKAKRQASRVGDISGRQPATASASIVKLFKEPITIDLIDPEPNPNIIISWDIDDSKFFPAYYGPFIRRLNDGPTQTKRIRGLEYSLTNIKEFNANLWLGLPQLILDNPRIAIRVANSLYESDVSPESNQRVEVEQKLSIGYDGILLSDGFPEGVI